MSSVRESDLNLLYGRWSELTKAGQVVSVEELCEEEGFSDQPELVVELSKRIELARSVSQFVSGPGASQFPTADFEMDSGEMASEVEPESESEVKAPIDTTFAGDLTTTWQTKSVKDATGDRGPAANSQSDIVSFSRFDSPELIARGGLGEVFCATEVVFGRQVALKFIRPDCALKQSHAQVFKTEAEITARLEHPGVVPIYAIGADNEGKPFYVMRLVKGRTLDDHIKEFHKAAQGSDFEQGQHAVAFRKLLTQFVSMCNTIGYAHRRGVLHRDIKPQNVMLGKYGETLVVDWGLAKSIERDDTDRSSGEETLMPNAGDNDVEFAQGIVGTPNYMSPEQADGNLPVGKPTDIYSLGATLYKILTGEMAFQSDSIGSTLARVRQGDFSPPQQRLSHVPAELNAICCKAMAITPINRYETAVDLAADIERYLADEPVTALQESWKCRAGRWLRHHSTVVKAIAATGLVVLLAATAILSNVRQQSERLVAEQRNNLEYMAITKEQMLHDDIENLLLNVRFMARQPAAVASVSEDDAAAKQEIAGLFKDFISNRLSYMQVRLLDTTGTEVVRVERTTSSEEVKSAERLQDKSTKEYFREPMKKSRDQIYLSDLNLNEENGVKDWEFPVVRAAAPIFPLATDAQAQSSALGVAVINLHFASLASQMKSSEDAKQQKLLVYLTNEAGQFLMHPTDGIAFRFEKGEELDYGIDEVYPELMPFLDSSLENESEFIGRTFPEPGILVESSIGQIKQLISQVTKKFPEIQRKYNKDRTRAVLTDMSIDQVDRIRDYIREINKQVSIRQLPSDDAIGEQAVYCRKIYLDFEGQENGNDLEAGNDQQDGESDKRYLNLVLAQPYK